MGFQHFNNKGYVKPKFKSHCDSKPKMEWFLLLYPNEPVVKVRELTEQHFSDCDSGRCDIIDIRGPIQPTMYRNEEWYGINEL